MSASDRSSISVGDSCCKEQASISEPSLSRLVQKPELCESTTNTPEASSAAQQVSTQSAAGVDNLSTEHLSPPNLSCQNYQDSPEHSGKSHTAFTESLAQLNRIRDDPFSTYPSSPYAINPTEEIKHICETDNPLINGGSGASIGPLLLENSISPKNSCNESKMKRGQHPVYPITSAQSIGQLFKTSDDVPLRQHD
jgi:hypothetical protein